MRISAADQYDSTWEAHAATFRVYLARGVERTVTTVDVTDATFGEVLAWARAEAAPTAALVAVALVGRDARGLPGLTWLIGMDPDDVPEDALQTRLRAEMLAAAEVPVP